VTVLQEEPLVLPAKVPHLLVNGAQGIAVGIATKIPPHNLHEVTAALRALVAQPDLSSQQLMQYIPAPDFPTGEHCQVQGLLGAAAADPSVSGSSVCLLFCLHRACLVLVVINQHCSPVDTAMLYQSEDLHWFIFTQWV
jgi:hypothetical protein